MKKLFTRVVFGSTLLAAATSQGITFSDSQTINRFLTAGGESFYAGSFNIVSDGFVPGVHTVYSANIAFNLGDGRTTQTANFLINLDGIYNNSQFTSFLVLGTDQVGIDLLTSLNADGILSYNVSATSGDFWLASASLSAEATGSQLPDRSVPDSGSTILFTALALSGLVLLRTKVLKAA